MFTRERYVHLLEAEEAPALDLSDVLQGGNNGATHATETDRTRSESEVTDGASQSRGLAPNAR